MDKITSALPSLLPTTIVYVGESTVSIKNKKIKNDCVFCFVLKKGFKVSVDIKENDSSLSVNIK